MLDILLKFAQKAGKLMAENSSTVKSNYKDNSVLSIVTQTDVMVSDLFAKTIKKHFSNLNYMIIDEEKIGQYGDDIFKAINNTDYQFVIDPIDGTIQYAYAHPLYGITIGVYKKRKPLLGIIYMPVLGELIYSDGKKAYLVKNAFKRNAVQTEIKKQKTSQSPIAFGNLVNWKFTPNYSNSHILFFNYFSAVSQTAYTLLSRAKSCCIRSRLWDVAGVIPIAECVGMKIFEYDSEKPVDYISEEFFHPDMWMKKKCILCHKQDFKEIASWIKPLVI